MQYRTFVIRILLLGKILLRNIESHLSKTVDTIVLGAGHAQFKIGL